MARIRSIKPEFWVDQDMADLPRDARLMYVGLWNLADEHGRLHGDPRYIKGQLFPYDDDMTAGVVDSLLSGLSRAGKVQRYRAGTNRYLYLPNLAKHQRLDADKVRSKIPAAEDGEPEPEPPSGSFPDWSGNFPDLSAPGVREFAGAAPTGPGSSAQPVNGSAVSEWHDNVRHLPTVAVQVASMQVSDTQLIGPDLSGNFPDESAQRTDSSALLYVAGSMEHVLLSSSELAPPDSDDEPADEDPAPFDAEVADSDDGAATEASEDSYGSIPEDRRADVDWVCRHLVDRIMERRRLAGSKKPKPVIGQAWRLAAWRLMNRDGKTVEQIIGAIDWCQQDEFWDTNIESMATLRKQYDRLQSDAKRRPAGQVRATGPRTTDLDSRRAMLERAMDRARAKENSQAAEAINQ